VSELRHSPKDIIMSSRFERTHDLANHLEQLTDRLIGGDPAAGGELYLAFLATSDWEDVCGSDELGDRLVEALSPYRPDIGAHSD